MHLEHFCTAARLKSSTLCSDLQIADLIITQLGGFVLSGQHPVCVCGARIMEKVSCVQLLGNSNGV